MGSKYDGLTREERRDCRAWQRWQKEQRKAAKRKGTKA